MAMARTGRVLNLLVLVQEGLLDLPILTYQPRHPALQNGLPPACYVW